MCIIEMGTARSRAQRLRPTGTSTPSPRYSVNAGSARKTRTAAPHPRCLQMRLPRYRDLLGGRLANLSQTLSRYHSSEVLPSLPRRCSIPGPGCTGRGRSPVHKGGSRTQLWPRGFPAVRHHTATLASERSAHIVLTHTPKATHFPAFASSFFYVVKLHRIFFPFPHLAGIVSCPCFLSSIQSSRFPFRM